jgi:hypothetical protein
MSEFDNELDSDQGSGFEVDVMLALNTMNDVAKKHYNAYLRKLASKARPMPKGYTIQLDSNGNGLGVIGAPQNGREWLIRLLYATHSLYVGQQNTGSSAVGAAGAAVSTSLGTANNPANITGISVTIGESALAGQATVTLSGVLGGPYTWYLEESTTESAYLNLGLNLDTVGTATLSVGAVASGGPVSTNLFGTTDISPADVTFYRGNVISNAGNAPLPPTTVVWRFASTPAIEDFTSDVHRLLPNQPLVVGVQGGVPNGIVTGVAVILDQPAFSEYLDTRVRTS